MITQIDIAEAVANDSVRAAVKLLNLAETLLKERDEALRLKNAYREGWIRDAKCEPGLREPVSGLGREAFERYVDNTAQKLLEKTK